MAKHTKTDKQQAIAERPSKAEKQRAKSERKQSKAKKKLEASNASSIQARTEQTLETECLVPEAPANDETSASGCPCLPIEVWTQILGEEGLHTRDVKNARLTCKMLAMAGAKRQFHTIAFRRDRQDFQRVRKMLAYDESRFAQDVRAVRFESGWLDPNSMTRQLNHLAIESAKSIDPNVDPVLAVWNHPSRTDVIDEYITWYDKFLKRKQNYQNSKSLELALLKLPRLERIDITRKSTASSNALMLQLQSKLFDPLSNLA